MREPLAAAHLRSDLEAVRRTINLREESAPVACHFDAFRKAGVIIDDKPNELNASAKARIPANISTAIVRDPKPEEHRGQRQAAWETTPKTTSPTQNPEPSLNQTLVKGQHLSKRDRVSLIILVYSRNLQTYRVCFTYRRSC